MQRNLPQSTVFETRINLLNPQQLYDPLGDREFLDTYLDFRNERDEILKEYWWLFSCTWNLKGFLNMSHPDSKHLNRNETQTSTLRQTKTNKKWQNKQNWSKSSSSGPEFKCHICYQSSTGLFLRSPHNALHKHLPIKYWWFYMLQDWGKERKEVGILKIVVDGAGFKELNQEYLATSPDEIPTGLARCLELWYLLAKEYLGVGLNCLYLPWIIKVS